MIPTDIALSLLEQASYEPAPVGEVCDAGEDRAVITRLPGLDVLSIVGTRNLAGWLSDFDIRRGTLYDCPLAGPCEAGFAAGANALWPVVRPLIGARPLVIQGHSRAGPIAAMITIRCLSVGIKPVRVVAYESPWGVGPQGRDMILGAGVSGVTYWNGNDPVPLGPPESWLVPHVWPLVYIGRPRWVPVECHYMASVVTELSARQAVAA